MVGLRTLLTSLIAVMSLVVLHGNALAEEATPEPEAPAPAEPPEEGESAAPAEGEGAAPAEGEESASDVAKRRPLVRPEATTPRAPRVKLRKTPGAVSAEEIEQRTAQLRKSVETAEVRLRALAERVLSGKIGHAGANLGFAQRPRGPEFILTSCSHAHAGRGNASPEAGDANLRQKRG